MELRAAYGVVLLIAHFALATKKEPKCRSECLTKNSCGTWLDKTESRSGVYKLLESQLHLSCSFISLPTPVDVQWKYKPKWSSNKPGQWLNATCLQETLHECNYTSLGEHRSLSTCRLDSLTLDVSGTYRCEAFDGEPVFGGESVVEVIGIQSTLKVSEHLHYGKPGHVEVEVCSNPAPQIFWSRGDAIVQPGQSSHGYSASQLIPSRQLRFSEADNGPSSRIQFCYRNRLVIAQVSEKENSLKFLIASNGETLDIPLSPLHIKHRPSSSERRKPTWILLFTIMSAVLVPLHLV